MSNVTDPCVSIIVPVYNTAQYLRRCFDSLIAQTRDDIEIIVVDDGSTDGSWSVIEMYCKEHPSVVRCYRRQHKGLSSARRFGFELSRAPYIMFVDSDDWLDSSAVEKTLLKAEEEGCDLIYFLYERIDGNGKTTIKQRLQTGSLEEMVRVGSNSVHSKLWSRQLLEEKAEFPSIWHEDLAEVPALVSWSKKPGYLDEVLYRYCIRTTGSITASNRDPRRKEIIKALELCYERMNPAFGGAFRYKMAFTLANSLSYIDWYDAMVEEGRRVYEQYSLDDQYDFLPELQRRRIDRMLRAEPVVPKRLYLNGLRVDDYDQTEIASSFCGDYEIVWLDDSTDGAKGDVFVERALEVGNLDFVGSYLAVRQIAERGGVYCSPSIRFPHTLNSLLFEESSFAFEDARRVSCDYFAGAPKSRSFARACKAFEVISNQGMDLDMACAITSVLVSDFGLTANGHGQLLNFEAGKVYSVEWFKFLPLIGKGVIHKIDSPVDPAPPFSLAAFSAYQEILLSRLERTRASLRDSERKLKTAQAELGDLRCNGSAGKLTDQ